MTCLHPVRPSGRSSSSALSPYSSHPCPALYPTPWGWSSQWECSWVWSWRRPRLWARSCSWCLSVWSSHEMSFLSERALSLPSVCRWWHLGDKSHMSYQQPVLMHTLKYKPITSWSWQLRLFNEPKRNPGLLSNPSEMREACRRCCNNRIYSCAYH